MEHGQDDDLEDLADRLPGAAKSFGVLRVAEPEPERPTNCWGPVDED